MEKIEQPWFRQNLSCPELNNYLSSYNIGLDSFWGLFLVVGMASYLTLIICMTTFLYENGDASVQLERRKIKALAIRFDKKDLSSHTFRKSEIGDRSVINGMDATASPATNYLSSPSSLFVQT